VPLYERGKAIERGRSPLSLIFPSPANINTGVNDGSGWRGVRGEVKIVKQLKKELRRRGIDKGD